MRGVLFAVALALGLAIAVPASTAALGGSSSSVAAANSGGVMAVDLQPEGKDFKVDVNVNRGGGRWYANPVWIAIGGLALVVLIVLIVMAMRGGGTTIVKE